jgi:MFS family permease
MVLASPVAGRLADAVGPRVIARVGTAVTLAGLGLLAAVSERSSEVTSAALAVVALGVGLSTAPAQATAMSDAPSRESGAAAGMLATARFLGGVVGITASGLSTAGRDAAAGLRATALCFLLPAGLALAASAWLPRQTRDGG